MLKKIVVGIACVITSVLLVFTVTRVGAEPQTANNPYLENMQKKFNQAHDNAAADFNKQYPKPQAPVLPQTQLVPVTPPATSPAASPEPTPLNNQPKAAQLPGPANVPGITPPANIYAPNNSQNTTPKNNAVTNLYG